MEKFLFDSEFSFIKNQAGGLKKWYYLMKKNKPHTKIIWLTKKAVVDDYEIDGFYNPKTPVLIFLN